ncbi:MAG: helix-turn-helix domain-containing protein [Nocardioidaceae bacterium]
MATSGAQGRHLRLSCFGLDGDAEALYRTVLRFTGESVSELSDRTGFPERLLRAKLQELVDRGLIRLTDDQVRAEPPDLALGRLVSERAHSLRLEEDQLATVRASIPEFVATHEGGRTGEWEPVPIDAIEIGDVVETMETLVRNSTGEMLFFRPDQFSLPSGQRMDEVVAKALRSGRRSRTLYPSTIAADPPERVRQRVTGGERVRAISVVPLRMAVFGRQAVLIPEDWHTPVGRHYVVRQPALVSAMIALFEAYWERGIAIPGLSHADDERPDDLVALLARGAKDEQVARLLGVSLRTVRRRIAALMDDLGVESRFQAGMEAVRRGHL